MYNILVCDDDKEIVEAIDIYLSQEGYHILKAYDGVEALNILEKEKVNLLILDVMSQSWRNQGNSEDQGDEQCTAHCSFCKSQKIQIRYSD